MTEVDDEGIHFPHDDALVIAGRIGNFQVKRQLVDTGCSVDILFLDVFEKMGYEHKALKPAHGPLRGFNGPMVSPLGVIDLPVTLEEGDKQKTCLGNLFEGFFLFSAETF